LTTALGAGANLGADLVAKSAPDGYTIFNADNGVMVNNKYLYKKLPYDADRDLRPVSLLVRTPLVLVVPASSSAVNLQSFIFQAKGAVGGWSYGSPGNGTPHHLAMEAFKQRTGVVMTHVPYRGAAPAVTDLVAGQVQAMLLDLSTAGPFISAGRLRALAVAAPGRLASLPNVPTMTESGLDFEAILFVGAVAPSGTPDALVARLAAEMARAVRTPDVARKLIETGSEPIGSTPEEFAKLVQHTSAEWGPLIQKLGIVLD
jgi:tripartite-type tricarboxylate transporter receptor subunit TctC